MELMVQLAKDHSSLPPSRLKSRTKSERRNGVEGGLVGCIRDPERRRKSQGMAENVNSRRVLQLVDLADFVHHTVNFCSGRLTSLPAMIT